MVGGRLINCLCTYSQQPRLGLTRGPKIRYDTFPEEEGENESELPPRQGIPGIFM